MGTEKKKIRSAVKHEHAERYLLTSLIAFGVTVIGVRVFLQLTGFPQLGNSVLHIAHALWGGLLLFVAVMLPLALANRWAIEVSAVLSGLGVGLFIDEVGKFITQTNDYFFPPALPVIYGFFLLIALIYLYFRRTSADEPRKALYHVLEGLKDALDGDLDPTEAARIKKQLAIAIQSDREELATLAKTLETYMQTEADFLVPARPGFQRRFVALIDASATRLGRHWHHIIISCILILWALLALGFVFILILNPASLESEIVEWRNVLIAAQALVGMLIIIAAASWFSGNEEIGMRFAISGFLLSLIGLQTIYFYLSQFQAITVTLLQLLFLLIIYDYRRRYLLGPGIDK